MDKNFWLTVSKSKIPRVTKTKPGLDWDEVTIKLNLNIPDALFDRPRLEASITIPEEVVKTEVLSADVVENVQEAIKTATGLEMKISVIQDEPEIQE